MSVRPIRVGVIGSGLISGIYLKNMSTRFEILQVKGGASAHPENANPARVNVCVASVCCTSKVKG